jgi:hypothetical protein
VAHAEADFTEPSLRQLRTVDRGHGRRKVREYFVADAPPALLRGGAG